MSTARSIRIHTGLQRAGAALLVAMLTSGCGQGKSAVTARPAAKADAFSSDGFYNPAWSPDHTKVAVLEATASFAQDTPADRLTILGWDDEAAGYLPLACLAVAVGGVRVAWSLDGELVAMGSYAGRIDVYDTARQPAECSEEIAEPLATLDLGPSSMAFGRSDEMGDTIAVLQANGTLLLWKPRTDELAAGPTGLGQYQTYLPDLHWSSQDRLLIDGLETIPTGDDGFLFAIWDAGSDEVKRVFPRTENGYAERITSPRWAPDGESFVASRRWTGPDGFGPPMDVGPHGALVLYDAEGAPLWEQGSGGIADIAWRPDGGLLAVAHPSWRAGVDILELAADGRSLLSRGTNDRRFYQVAWPRCNVLAGFVRDDIGQPFELVGDEVWWIEAPPATQQQPTVDQDRPSPAQQQEREPE